MDEEEPQTPPPSKGSSQRIFVNVDDIKSNVRKSLALQNKEIVIYKEAGHLGKLAKSDLFEKVCLIVICLNAIWLMIDVDYNTEPLLINADPVFQVVENFFCAWFTCEWVIRFGAYANKWEVFTDKWFMFDTCLVAMMVVETWVMTLITLLSTGGSSGGLGSLSVLRLLRLLRLTRMAKLMRAIPELLILIKALMSAARSVALTMILLTIIIYVFAIIFVQLLPESEAWREKFGTVPSAMFTLLLDGILPDQAPLAVEMADEYWVLGMCFLLFVAISTLTLINMLIGIICEVVAEASHAEKERTDIEFVRSRLKRVLEDTNLDVDGDGLISKAEFLGILEYPQAVKALRQVGVDAVGLLDHADYVFASDELEDEDEDGFIVKDDKRLTFDGFMACVLELRQNNKATVRDVCELRKFVHQRLLSIEGMIAGRQRVANRMELKEAAQMMMNDATGTTKGEDFGKKYTTGSTAAVAVDVWAKAPKSTPQTMRPTATTAAPLQPVGPTRESTKLSNESTIATAGEVVDGRLLLEVQDLQMRMNRMEGVMTRVAHTQGLILQRLSQPEPPLEHDLKVLNGKPVFGSVEACPEVVTPAGARSFGVHDPRKGFEYAAGPWESFIGCTSVGRAPSQIAALRAAQQTGKPGSHTVR